MSSKTGRRRGRPDTRKQILAAAGELFAAHGYNGASIRAIASLAEVDPALVHHYFGSKEALFRVTLNVPVDPQVLIEGALAGGVEEAPLRLAEAFLAVVDSEETGPAMVSYLRRALSDPEITEMVRGFLEATVLRTLGERLLPQLDQSEQAARLSLAFTQMAGVVIARKVLRLQPIASMPADLLAATVAPSIARYLNNELPVLDERKKRL